MDLHGRETGAETRNELTESCTKLDELIAPSRNADHDPSTQAPSADAEDPDVDEVLFQKLRAWRIEQAQSEEVPAYCVFHDRHLRAIAADQPLDLKELSEVRGVGPKRLKKYGSAVLAVVRGHLKDEAT
jgi:superfamily II DNA helicase RecQ